MNTRIIAIALFAAACTTNERNGALIVTKVVGGTQGTTTPAPGAPPPPCTFNGGDGELILPVYDPATAATPGANAGAAAGFVISNRLVDPSTLNPVLNTTTNSFTAHQAVVDYEIPGVSVPEQIIPVSGSVPTLNDTPVVVELFSPAAVKTALAGVPDSFVRTTTRIEGRLDDGTTVSTSAHEFVVHVCPGCGETACF